MIALPASTYNNERAVSEILEGNVLFLKVTYTKISRVLYTGLLCSLGLPWDLIYLPHEASQELGL